MKSSIITKRNEIQKTKNESGSIYNLSKKYNKKLTAEYAGEKLEYVNASLISTKNMRDYTTLVYDVDVLPSDPEKN